MLKLCYFITSGASFQHENALKKPTVVRFFDKMGAPKGAAHCGGRVWLRILSNGGATGPKLYDPGSLWTWINKMLYPVVKREGYGHCQFGYIKSWILVDVGRFLTSCNCFLPLKAEKKTEKRSRGSEGLLHRQLEISSKKRQKNTKKQLTFSINWITITLNLYRDFSGLFLLYWRVIGTPKKGCRRKEAWSGGSGTNGS